MTITSLLLHSHKKQRDNLETRAVLLIFSLEREIFGVALQSIHQKTTKTSNFCKENDFEAVLATFRCYEHGAKASEAVQKIDTDQKEYRKSITHQSITVENV